MPIMVPMANDTLPRPVGPSLQDRLRVMPAVVVTGAPSDGEEHPSPGALMPGGRRFPSLGLCLKRGRCPNT